MASSRKGRSTALIVVVLLLVLAVAAGVVVFFVGQDDDASGVDLPEVEAPDATRAWLLGDGATVVRFSDEIGLLLDDPPLSSEACEQWVIDHLEPLGTPSELAVELANSPDQATGEMALDTLDVSLRWLAACVQSTEGPTVDELRGSHDVLSRRISEVVG